MTETEKELMRRKLGYSEEEIMALKKQEDYLNNTMFRIEIKNKEGGYICSKEFKARNLSHEEYIAFLVYILAINIFNATKEEDFYKVEDVVIYNEKDEMIYSAKRDYERGRRSVSIADLIEAV